MNFSSSKKNTITEGSITKGILTFFFPILLGMFFQQFYNTADAIIVGRFIGKEALAAVGGGSAVFINLLVGFFSGLTAGPSIIISQFYGAKKEKELNTAILTSLAIAIFMGILLTFLGLFFSPLAIKLLRTPEDIFDLSLQYLSIFCTGIIPMFLYNIGSGIIRSSGDSKTPFYILVISCFLNVILDLIFVVVLDMGVKGAAWATVISQAISAVLVLLILLLTKKSYKLSLKGNSVSLPLLFKMLKLGLPTGLESSMYTISNLLLQAFINSLGTSVIAAWAAWGKMETFFWMTVCSFGIALSTFSGQNYGAHQYERIKSGVKRGFIIIYTITFAIMIVFLLLGKTILSVFTTDAEVLENALTIMTFLLPAYIAYVPIEVLCAPLNAAGNTMQTMIFSLLGICGFRTIWLLTVGNIHPSLTTFITCYPLSWTLTSILFALYYIFGNWLHVDKKLISKSN